MISLEQIRLLEAKINKAVERIKTLKAENTTLRKTLDSAQSRMQDLEKLVGDLKTDQKEIEASILRAIKNLDQLEDEVSRPNKDTDANSAGAARAGEARNDDQEAEPEASQDGESDGEPEGASGDGPSGHNGDSEKELDIF